ncbi:MAG: chemotaxis protein CheC [Oscillospiraceae bacterium]
MLDKSDGIDSAQIDIICEIGNIGAGNAATALSGMLGRTVEMSVPKVKIVPLTDIPGLSGAPDSPVVGGVVDMSGDLTGQIMLILGINEAYNMACVICGRNKNTGTADIGSLSELDMSALGEVMNILAGSYLSAVSSLTGLVIVPSIPYMCVDMAGAMLSVVAIECGKAGDSALFFETRFSDAQDNTSCNFFLLPDRKSYKKLMKSLGVIL